MEIGCTVLMDWHLWKYSKSAASTVRKDSRADFETVIEYRIPFDSLVLAFERYPA